MTTQAVEERTLDTLTGPLLKTAPQFEPGTRRHADQITDERRTAEERLRRELRNQWIYTADSAVYTVEDGEVFLYLGREPTNPVLNNIEEAVEQLLKTGNYRPKPADIEAVVKAEGTLKVKLSDLELQRLNDELFHFEINTADYSSLNVKQREVAERVYGGRDFIKNMKMLNEAGIINTIIYVLNPDYVKKNVPQNGAIARASRLEDFGGASGFLACDNLVNYRNGMRGHVMPSPNAGA